MNDLSTIHQVTYIISIQSEYQQLGSPVFRGTLELVAGQKFEFGTLAELNGLLCEIGSWIDRPPCRKEVSEQRVRMGEEAVNVRRKSVICDPNKTKANIDWKEKDDEKNV